MPAALYPKKVKQQFAIRTRTGIVKSEIKDILLCADCEELFNRNGESEVLRYVAAKSVKSFPLLERLRVAVPREEHPEVSRFAGYEVGLDMNRFAYFAMSVVWRRAAHNWTLFDGSTPPGSPLGDFQEEIRRYLLQNSSLPPDMVVLVIVCTDIESRKLWTPPNPEVAENCINFRFLLRGIFFRVLIGKHMPALYRDLCCTSPRKCLFYGNARHRAAEILAAFERPDRNGTTTSPNE